MHNLRDINAELNYDCVLIFTKNAVIANNFKLNESYIRDVYACFSIDQKHSRKKSV